MATELCEQLIAEALTAAVVGRPAQHAAAAGIGAVLSARKRVLGPLRLRPSGRGCQWHLGASIRCLGTHALDACKKWAGARHPALRSAEMRIPRPGSDRIDARGRLVLLIGGAAHRSVPARARVARGGVARDDAPVEVDADAPMHIGIQDAPKRLRKEVTSD